MTTEASAILGALLCMVAAVDSSADVITIPCDIESNNAIVVVPVGPAAGERFAIHVCADARAFPDGFADPDNPVQESVGLIEDRIVVDVTVRDGAVLLGSPPGYWRTFTRVLRPGEYTIEYYTTFLPRPSAGFPGAPRTLRATLPLTIGPVVSTPVPALSTPGLAWMVSLLAIGGMASMVLSARRKC